MSDRVWTLKAGEEIATWEPVAAGTTYTPPTTRQAIQAEKTILTGTVSLQVLSFSTAAGDDLLDFTDPTHPRFRVAGVYAITVDLVFAGASSDVSDGYMRGRMVADDAALSSCVAETLVAADLVESVGFVAMTKFFSAAEGFLVGVNNNTPDNHVCDATGVVQRIS